MPDAPQSHALWFAEALLPQGWARDVRISVDAGVITAIERAPPQPQDERHAIGLPGLCNVHSHAFQRGMAGLAETRGPADDDFWSWREVMYRFLDRLDPDAIQAIAELAYMDMLESGFTRVGEFHYLHNDPSGARYAHIAETAARIADAAQATGIGLTLLPVFYAHADFGGAPPKPGQRRFLSSVDSFLKLVEASRAVLPADGVLGIAPHSLRAVTPEELQALLQAFPSGPVHIHAAEQTKEVEASVAYSGLRPVEWLLQRAGVDARWCLVHATHMTADETKALAASGAVAGLCPVTEANLGDGVFPTDAFLRHGGRFGVGTDSNIAIDAGQELRALEYAQRLTRRGRNILAGSEGASVGATLFSRALAGGAQALGVRAELAVGAGADLVSLDPAHDALAGRHGDALLDSWIFATRRPAIDCVWRRGARVVSGGVHHDSARIRARYARTLRALLA